MCECLQLRAWCVDAEEAELPCAIQDNRNGSYTLSFTVVAAGPFTVLLEERGVNAGAGAAEGGADDAERRLEVAGSCECREVGVSEHCHTRERNTHTHTHSHTPTHTHPLTHTHSLSTGGREQVRAGSDGSDGRRVDRGATWHRHRAAVRQTRQPGGRRHRRRRASHQVGANTPPRFLPPGTSKALWDRSIHAEIHADKGTKNCWLIL